MTGEPRRGLQGPGCRIRTEKEGSNIYSKLCQMQACDAGRRDKRKRLADGGCRQRPGGRRFKPGCELGSRYYKIVGYEDGQLLMGVW